MSWVRIVKTAKIATAAEGCRAFSIENLCRAKQVNFLSSYSICMHVHLGGTFWFEGGEPTNTWKELHKFESFDDCSSTVKFSNLSFVTRRSRTVAWWRRCFLNVCCSTNHWRWYHPHNGSKQKHSQFKALCLKSCFQQTAKFEPTSSPSSPCVCSWPWRVRQVLFSCICVQKPGCVFHHAGTSVEDLVSPDQFRKFVAAQATHLWNVGICPFDTMWVSEDAQIGTQLSCSFGTLESVCALVRTDQHFVFMGKNAKTIYWTKHCVLVSFVRLFLRVKHLKISYTAGRLGPRGAHANWANWAQGSHAVWLLTGHESAHLCADRLMLRSACALCSARSFWGPEALTRTFCNFRNWWPEKVFGNSEQAIEILWEAGIKKIQIDLKIARRDIRLIQKNWKIFF